MKTLSIVVNARVQSSRIDRKIVRQFAKTTLLDILLSKLSSVQDFSVYLAAGDDEIFDIHSKYPRIHLLKRSQESIEKGWKPHHITFEHYSRVPTSHIMMVNCCLPFIKVQTILDAAIFFLQSDYQSMTSVKEHRNVFFDSDHNIVTDNTLVSTQHQKPVYEMAHAFHVFDKEYFLQKGYFWDYSSGHPGLFIVPSSECFDIDSPVDFLVCDTLYKTIGDDLLGVSDEGGCPNIKQD